jgi:Fe-S cluster assembly protein SufD
MSTSTPSLPKPGGAAKANGGPDGTQFHVALFEKLEQNRFSSQPQWLQSLRKAGISHFAELGFPTIQNEEWRFTNVSHLNKLRLEPLSDAPDPKSLPSKEVVAKLSRSLPSAIKLVFLDGHFIPGLSDLSRKPEGLLIQNLASSLEREEVENNLSRFAKYNDNPFIALNTALFADGVFIRIAKGLQVEDPIHIVQLSSGTTEGRTSHLRNLVLAESGSRCFILETYVSLGEKPGFTNAVSEFKLEPTAHVEHCKFQDESQHNFHIATIQAHQEKESNFVSHSISIGGKLTRNNIHSVLDAERAESTLNGLYIGHDDQLVDHHTVIDHAKPHCNSHEFYHGILGATAKGVFNGKIFVRKDAQKTDAKQTNKCILLSDSATIDTKPQLEIFADDVKCTHGATVGQLDDNAIFYLRSRGIHSALARRILTYAFASEIVDRISNERAREDIGELIKNRLAEDYQDIESL